MAVCPHSTLILLSSSILLAGFAFHEVRCSENAVEAHHPEQVFRHWDNSIQQGRVLKRMGMPPWVKWALKKTPANTTTDEPTDSDVVDQAETPTMPATATQEVISPHPHSRTLLPCYMHPVSCFGHANDGRRQSRNLAFRGAKVYTRLP
ncbi:hypothetical protein RvY_12520 [Ramazzottius varieornatus]|uniref:Secreted protein n=1 Tax=Ramazzottius varieornatus TaxID=947166 RepID=A0A1D1VLR2_RAMVA|nr:hypothetical protein RvY_12520 [Ramazzottius varieornatus]